MGMVLMQQFFIGPAICTYNMGSDIASSNSHRESLGDFEDGRKHSLMLSS
jgi:hypothetical protein